MMMNVADVLTYLKGCRVSVSKGRVSLKHDDRGDVPLPAGCAAYLDSHPEGSDRGGYVPYIELPSGEQIMYEEHANEWTEAG